MLLLVSLKRKQSFTVSLVSQHHKRDQTFFLLSSLYLHLFKFKQHPNNDQVSVLLHAVALT